MWVPVRVIAGSSRGRALRAPAGNGTRPTADRVREAIFNVLAGLLDMEGAAVVDLFAGSGAMGIEALSRGAESVTFVDNSLAAVRAVRSNVTGTGLDPDATRVVRAEVVDWLLRPHRFDLALCAGPAGPAPCRCGRDRVGPAGGCARHLGDHQEQALRRYARRGAPFPTAASTRRVAPERHLVTVALIPGSFDPFHNGHLEVVERAGRLFDDVVVATLRNPQKAEPLFSLAEREEMLKEALAHLPNVRIVSVSKLVVDVAHDVGASAIVKGLRAVSDFENELQMAQMNRQLSGIETLFIPTTSTSAFVASRLLREVARYGGDVSAFVPKVVALRLQEKFSK